MGDAKDMEERASAEARKWITRMRKDNPAHARLYCDHGVYIGSNGLFRHKCKPCTDNNPERSA